MDDATPHAPVKRRELLQLGAASVAALGAGSCRCPSPPSSVRRRLGQGPQPPKPPAPEAVANLGGDARRGLDRAVDLAAVRVAQPDARAQHRRQCAPASRDLARQSLHAAVQLQRRQSRAHDPHARQRATARHGQESPRTQLEPRAEGTRTRPVRSASRRARRRVLPDAEGRRARRATRRRTRTTDLRPLPRVLRGQPGRAGRHELPLAVT